MTTAGKSIALRAEEGGDLPFLRSLYDTTRAAEMAACGWPPAMQAAFLADQFRLQDHHYRTQFPDIARHIVLRRRRPVGRLYLRWVAAAPAAWPEIRLVDVALLPECRGRGVGRALLERLHALAASEGALVSLTVYADNPAARLYRRLGFQQMEQPQPGGRLLMHWRPAD